MASGAAVDSPAGRLDLDDLTRQSTLRLEALVDRYLSQDYIDGRINNLKEKAKEQVR